MLEFQITKRTKVYCNLEKDTYPNIGGFYCTLYGDNSTDFPICSFTILKKEIAGNGTSESVAKERAIKIAQTRAIRYMRG